MKNKVSVSEIIRHERRKRGWTLVYTSEKTGVSNPYISQLEHGRITNPSPPILKKLADGMGITYHELMVAAGYLEACE